MTPSTAEWVRKAEGHFDVVLVLRRSRKPSRFDSICFHCQQCAEKYLKARLNEARIPFTKTHDLGGLLDLLRRAEPLWLVMKPKVDELTQYAVVVRYPGAFSDRRHATEAWKICVEIRELARLSLGLKR